MNIEQLEKGKELRKEISDLNQTQKELIENYKKHVDSCNKGISISFRPKEQTSLISVDMDDMIRQEVFNLINNYIMKKITNKETEFSNL